MHTHARARAHTHVQVLLTSAHMLSIFEWGNIWISKNWLCILRGLLSHWKLQYFLIWLLNKCAVGTFNKIHLFCPTLWLLGFHVSCDLTLYLFWVFFQFLLVMESVSALVTLSRRSTLGIIQWSKSCAIPKSLYLMWNSLLIRGSSHCTIKADRPPTI